MLRRRQARLSLASQTTWWTPGQPFTISVEIQTTTPDQLELAVTVFGKLANRTAFLSTVDGRVSSRGALEPIVVSLLDAPTDGAGNRVVSFVPDLRVDGVYPVRVDLRPRGGGKAVASFVTHLIEVPSVLTGGPLTVATLVPIHARPAVQPDGTVNLDDSRAQALGELAGALAAQPVPLTLSPTAETVAALAESPRDADRATLATLTQGQGGDAVHQVLGGTFVPTNLTSLIDAGLAGESMRQIAAGTEVLRARFGTAPTLTTRLVDERLDAAALDHLRVDQMVDHLIVPESLLEPVTRNTTLTNTFQLDGREPMDAAMADESLTAHFNEADPVLAAQHLLADLAVLYNDDPGQSARGAVVSPGRGWEPRPAFVGAYLDGLATSPILRAATIDQFFAAVAPAGSKPLVRRIAAAPEGSAPPLGLPGGAIRSMRARIDAFASALDPANPKAAAVLLRLDRTLLAVESGDLRSRDRTRYLAGVNEQINTQVAGVAMPKSRSITLTAREGEIPVTITNQLGYPVKAVLRVVSDTLDFPAGDRHELALDRDNTTSQFTVRAQSSGSFPLRVRLETPGGLLLDESRFTVRSTAISGVGTALSIGAGLFLVVWWGNHLRGRRSRRLVPAS